MAVRRSPKPLVGVRFPPPEPSIGLKVFMDAHMPVTHKEGDRYPLRPPKFYSAEPEQGAWA